MHALGLFHAYQAASLLIELERSLYALSPFGNVKGRLLSKLINIATQVFVVVGHVKGEASDWPIDCSLILVADITPLLYDSVIVEDRGAFSL